jgi:hypothetical protein
MGDLMWNYREAAMNAALGRRTGLFDFSGSVRKLVGVVWLGGALFNTVWTLRQSDPWSWLEESPVPAYQWFFGDVVSRNPGAWTIGLIVGEAVLGILTLLPGRRAKIGLVGGACFSAFLFSLALPYTLIMGGYALLLAWLARRQRSSN